MRLGRKNDMLNGPEWVSIMRFSVPLMFGNLLQQLYNTVDGMVVGNYIDSAALAAVGNCSAISFFLISFAIGISTGCGIVIAQCFGAQKHDEVKGTVSSGAILMLGVGVLISLLGIIFARPILAQLLRIEDPAVLEYAVTYLKIYCAGLVLTYGYNLISAALRAVGDSAATLYFLAISSVVNLVLDLVLVKPMGVAGAALATVIAQGLCFVCCVVYMYARHPAFRFGKGDFTVQPDKLLLCLRLGIPGALQQCSVSLGHLVMQRLVNHFGVVTMAAYTVGAKIERYVSIPLSGMQMGISTFTGQNVGAEKPERIKRGLYQSELVAIIITAALSIPAYIFARPLVSIFGLTGDEITQAVEYVRFLVPLCTVIFAMYFIFNGLLQGAGDVMYTTFCSLSSLIARIIYAYVMTFVFSASYSICWYSIFISNAWSLVFAAGRYYSGAWKKKSQKIIQSKQ